MKDCTVHEAAQAYLEHLRTQGKKDRTLYTYGKDFEQMEAFFGADRKLRTILPPHVGKFLKSDDLLRLPSGAERAKPTVDKTVRVLHVPRLGERNGPTGSQAVAQGPPHGPEQGEGERRCRRRPP